MAAAHVTGMKSRKRLRFGSETVENEGSRKENKANASQVTPFVQPLAQLPSWSNTSPALSPLAEGSPQNGFDSDATEEQKARPRLAPVVKLADKFDAARSETQVYDLETFLRLNAIAVMSKGRQSRQEQHLSVDDLDRALDELINCDAPTLLDISHFPSKLTAEDEARLDAEDKISSEQLRRLKREWAERGRDIRRKLANLQEHVEEMIASDAREVASLVAAEEARKEDTTW